MKNLNDTIKMIFILILTVFISNGFAQEMTVPVNLQAALFKKIFPLDKTLQSKGNIEISILTGSGSGDEIAAAFKTAGIAAKTFSGNQVPSGASVVYIMPGVSSPKQQTSSKGVLSISGVAAYAEQGQAAIAIGSEGGKPKIIINIGQLKAEGHELSAELLKIAKVIN